MADLDQRLLQAHADKDHQSLIALYQEAANASTDPAAAAFYLTHAWVFALETGHRDATALYQRLAQKGRA